MPKINELFQDDDQDVSVPERGKASDLFSDTATDKPAGDGIFTRAARNILPSAWEQVKILTTAAFHPIQTVKGISNLAVGLAKKALPGEAEKTPSVQTSDAVIDFYKQRYGSLEKAKETFAEDPVGFLMDASTVISGGAGAVKAAAGVARASRVAAVAGAVEKAGALVDPLALMGKGINKVTKAASKGLTPVVDDAAKAAAGRLGVDLTAGMATKSKITPELEAFSERLLLSGGKMSERVNLAKTQVQAAADSIISHAGPEEDAITIGKELIKANDSFHDNWVKVKNQMYDEVKIPVTAWIGPVQTRTVVETIVKQRESASKIIGSASKENPFSSILDSIAGKKVKLSDFRNAIKQLNETITSSTDPVVTGNKAALKKVVAVMSDEFDAKLKELNPEIADRLDAANAYYKSGLDVMNSSIGKVIDAYRTDPSKIISALVKKSTSVEDIGRINELLGSESLPQIRRAVMEDIIESGRKVGGDASDFKSTGLAQGMKKYGNKLESIFTPEQLAQIKDLDSVIKAVKRVDLDKGSIGTIGSVAGQVAVFSGLMMSHPLVSISMLVGDSVAARFIASDFGQKVLMTGKLGEQMPKINGKIDVDAALKIMRQVGVQSGRQIEYGSFVDEE